MTPRKLQDEAGVEEVDKGWLVEGIRSWKVSLHEVDWTYRRRFHWTETGEKLPLHPRTPCYYSPMVHADGIGEESDCSPLDEEVDLNASLVGVTGAEDVIRRYEESVGMADKLDLCLDGFNNYHRPLFLGEFDDDNDVMGHSQWAEVVDQLLGGIFEPGSFTVSLNPDYGLHFMTTETSSLSGKDPLFDPSVDS
jgi:hypothetical protein